MKGVEVFLNLVDGVEFCGDFVEWILGVDVMGEVVDLVVEVGYGVVDVGGEILDVWGGWYEGEVGFGLVYGVVLVLYWDYVEMFV